MSQSFRNDQEERKRKAGFLRRLLRIFGVHCAEERGRWVVLTRRFPFVVLALGIGLLVAFGGFVHLSSAPRFCNICHFMKLYVASWKSSAHNMVSCTKCHFSPGLKSFVRGKVAALSQVIKTVTNTHAPKPHAEVEDAACLRGGCHEMRLLDGEAPLKGEYSFRHVPHLTGLRRGKKLRCTSCHSHIIQGEHMTVAESVCFACHFKGRAHEGILEPVAGCTSCHKAPKEPIELLQGVTFEHEPFVERGVPCWKCHSDSVEGTGEVPPQVCLDCHEEPEKLAKYADSQLVHDWHVTRRKVECLRCHSEIRHGLNPEPLATEAGCATCHGADHAIQRDMYAGRGGKGVEGMPSEHFLSQVDCVACHEMAGHQRGPSGAGMATLEATQKPCLECHGEAVEGTLEMWQAALDETLAEVKSELAKAQQVYALQPPDSARSAEARTMLEAARHDCEFVETARGVHNPGYALELLDKAMTDAEEAARILNLSKAPEVQSEKTEE